jgi:hypothetical protein
MPFSLCSSTEYTRKIHRPDYLRADARSGSAAVGTHRRPFHKYPGMMCFLPHTHPPTHICCVHLSLDAAVLRHLQLHSTDPFTGLPLSRAHISACLPLRMEIEAFRLQVSESTSESTSSLSSSSVHVVGSSSSSVETKKRSRAEEHEGMLTRRFITAVVILMVMSIILSFVMIGFCSLLPRKRAETAEKVLRLR